MKKKYLIVLISFAVLLICSCIVIGIMTAKLMNRKNKDVVYEIGETSLVAITEHYPDDLDLVGFSYNTDNNIYIKTYNYKVKNDNVETIVSYYTEYLTSDLEFINESETINSTYGKYIFEKTFEENADSLIIEINYTETTLNIILTYTYLDE